MNPSAEQRLEQMGITLPAPPKPLGAYVPAVQVGNLLFLSGTLPLEGGVLKYQGRLGSDLSVDEARSAARLAALNALALARQHLGSLDRVTRIVRLTISMATMDDFRDHAKVADGASELLASVFGADKAPTRMVSGVLSLPAGACLVVELLLAVD